MTDREWFPVALKRAWVPEWLFRLACHWLPLAQLLCETPRCRCGVPAVAYTDGVFECREHALAQEGETP